MNDNDQTGNNNHEMATLTRNGDGQFERLWAYDGFGAGQDQPADFAAGLVSLEFIKAAIRRGARFWCATAVVGLLAGIGLQLAAPPAYQASTSVFITHGPDSYPPTAINNDQAIAQSRAVARLAMRRLGLRQSVSSFDAAYTVAAVSDRVLQITVSAPSSNDAVRRANAVAAAFLSFRADMLETEQNLVLSSLDQQISQTRRYIDSTSRQISQLPKNAASSTQRVKLGKLRTELNQATATLATLDQTAQATKAGTATTSSVKGSEVLDAAAPIAQSRLSLLLFYAASGLLAGLVLGVGIVVVRALTSDRLRRRDHIAHALGAPMKLSVGAMPLSRRLRRLRLTGARRADIQRIVAHLRSAMPASSRGPAALAVIPVGDPQVAALSLVSLAVSGAQQGKQVVLADLCSGSPAAMLLGVRDPGVHTVNVKEARLAVAVPDRDDVAPLGPRRPRTRRPRTTDRASAQAQSPFTDAVTAACASADLLLTLATLDPSLGGDHLATWTTHAVAMVTAGKSSATKIHAGGEMIRLSGVRLVSGVLIGADKTDESLGATHLSKIDENGKSSARGLAF